MASGGFTVQETIGPDNSYGCEGVLATPSVCGTNLLTLLILVETIQYARCGGIQSILNPFVMWSPNTLNRGGGYNCVVGTGRTSK